MAVAPPAPVPPRPARRLLRGLAITVTTLGPPPQSHPNSPIELATLTVTSSNSSSPPSSPLPNLPPTTTTSRRTWPTSTTTEQRHRSRTSSSSCCWPGLFDQAQPSLHRSPSAASLLSTASSALSGLSHPEPRRPVPRPPARKSRREVEADAVWRDFWA